MATCINPRTIRVNNQSIRVDCNKCNFCLQNRRLDWVFRIMQHLHDQPSADFLTLTYDSEHIPLVMSKKWNSGYMTLDRNHLSNFHKLLKQANTRTLLFVKKKNKLTWKEYHDLKKQYRVTYYAVGEYGGRFGRPHYHTLVFGLHRLTLQKLHCGRIWEKGNIHFGKVTGASVGYVTAYLIDKNPNLPEEVQRPFSQISKGIGANYLTKKKNGTSKGSGTMTTTDTM